MGRSKTPKLPPDKEAPEPGEASSFPGVQLADHPIFLLVYFHKALREELAELRRIAVAALDNSQTQPRLAEDLIQEFLQRFKFLKLVYKYHCTAEDEIIFLALDEHKHVVCTYSLEHDNIDSLFDSVTRSFNVLTKGEESSSNVKTFEELVLCIGTIQRSICQHMLKEEEQIFPLLMGKFSTKQQASLMWQFICSVPIILMGELLPWMISFLSPLEQIEIRNCMEGIVPEEKLLKEVLTSWLGCNNYQNSGTWFKIAKGALYPDGSVNVQAILKLGSSKSYSGEHWHWKEAYCSGMTVVDKPIKGFRLWHGAMREDLNHIQKELYQIRRSRNFMNLASVVVQMKFLADVFLFYSDALEKIFYPVLNDVTNCLMSFSDKDFLDKGQLEGLLRLLHHTSHNEIASVKHVEKLCQEVESFVIGVGKHFAFQEAKVLPILSTNCSEELQKQLVYTSLQMMPLGLLQCTVSWFSAHLSEDESKHFLFTIKKENSSFNGSFSSLIHKWFLFGNRGKASIEKCRTVLHDMVKSSCCFLFKKNEEHIGSSSLNSSMLAQPSPKSNPTLMEPMSARKKGKKYVSSSSLSGSHTMSETSYSGGLNLHISFPATKKKSYPLLNIRDEKTRASSILNEPKPVDIIFYFHKALKKDLENLVFTSAQLVGNIGLLGDFSRRFQLIWFLYRIHTETEDEIAFPALEAKGKSPNISLSYTMDHKLQDKYFDGISSIVDEMSALHASISTADVNTFSDKMLTHSELCMKLHEMCKSMHKILLDHVHLEDIELWPLFREDFTIEEQEKIIGSMLGRTGAKTLQDMIPWLMEALTPEEQHNMMFLWREATRNTMFGEWLCEWWEGYDLAKEVDEPNTCPSQTDADPFHIISAYLSKGGTLEDKDMNCPEDNSTSTNIEPFGKVTADDQCFLNDDDHHDCKECTKLFSTDISSKVADITDHVKEPGEVSTKFSLHERLQPMSQKDLEVAIHRVSHDSSLDTKQKSFLMQNLLMSRWMATQKRSYSEDVVSCREEEIQGKSPSYQDNLKVNLGCKHYKRNCKLLAACCNKLYTCIRCHDEVADHTLDRKSITQMMCMKCLIVQPIGPSCSTTSCNSLSMARYYCSICKIFQDERKEIYHCPYCNLCRLGKGLGIDYFHCMNCNACMSRSLSVHPCRKKCFEDNCPICHEFIFTSRDPVKALPCGHMMHSKCFQAYTCNHYTCPICSKSLGDMQVYFSMLDALLAEEKMPDEYSSKTQAILCNDCEKRGTARYHWLHHKCSYCGSYNTRVL